ncbi:MAG: hypothetical protein AAF329_04550 [Cyanobacteria bacterium P01_A01_bin.17]
MLEHAAAPRPLYTEVRAIGFPLVSGQAGDGPETGKNAGEDFARQARRAFEHLPALRSRAYGLWRPSHHRARRFRSTRRAQRSLRGVPPTEASRALHTKS